MENKTEKEFAIFNQICKANDLDPQVIREEAKINDSEKKDKSEQVDSLIRAAFHHRANALVANLDISAENSDGSLMEGKEYNADGDPAAPSFTINDAYIKDNYSADKAEKIIAALGQVQLPIRA